jgi:hypothetical protein
MAEDGRQMNPAFPRTPEIYVPESVEGAPAKKTRRRDPLGLNFNDDPKRRKEVSQTADYYLGRTLEETAVGLRARHVRGVIGSTAASVI